jgi:hypothetical protein
MSAYKIVFTDLAADAAKAHADAVEDRVRREINAILGDDIGARTVDPPCGPDGGRVRAISGVSGVWVTGKSFKQISKGPPCSDAIEGQKLIARRCQFPRFGHH